MVVRLKDREHRYVASKGTLNKDRRRKRLPVLAAAGLSLGLGGGAPAVANVGTTDMPSGLDAVDQAQPLREEEITDINLSTFHISDRERTPPLFPRIAAGPCVACAASSEQPAYSGPITRMSPPARKPTRPYVQRFKRPQSGRQCPSTRTQAEISSKRALEQQIKTRAEIYAKWLLRQQIKTPPDKLD
jgi:hypothetical protein